VMIGVVFALLTGYSAVYTNIAFLLWTVLGGRSGSSVAPFRVNSIGSVFKKIVSIVTFNRVYLGLLAYTAFTGFASPLTFLVIAFAGERASVWTEKLLARILPKSAAAPSTAAAPVADPNKVNDAPPKWPAFHYMAKSALMLGSMAAVGVLLSVTVFGVTSLLTNLAVASVLAFVPFFFAKKIIKLLMKAQPTTKEQDPEFFEIMEGLRDKINADRRAKGKKEIPMPEMVIDPMDAPNAYATGRSPFAAMVGVTKGFKAMTLEPEIVRDGVVRLIASSDIGVWTLTDKGWKTELSHEAALRVFVQVRSEWRADSGNGDEAKVEPEEELAPENDAALTRDHRKAVLDLLQALPPDGFERFCQRLLRESGFQEVTVTGRPSDGGIDGIGILQVNPLVSFKVIFQCKRYKGLVSSPQVRDFRGAMQGRADKGIIITTSAGLTFTVAGMSIRSRKTSRAWASE